MLALADYEAALCPLCGGPRDECADASAEGQFEASAPTRCHRTTALLVAQEPYRETEYPQALLFGAKRRR